MSGSSNFLLPNNHKGGLRDGRARDQEKKGLEKRKPESRGGAKEPGRKWALEPRPDMKCDLEQSVKATGKYGTPTPWAQPDITYNNEHRTTLSYHLPLCPHLHPSPLPFGMVPRKKREGGRERKKEEKKREEGRKARKEGREKIRTH